MLLPAEKFQLASIANQIRRHILEMIFTAGGGHPAGALGMADIFSALYFGKILKYQPDQPRWPDRDYLILSNGHICTAQYAALALAGFFSPDELLSFRKLGSRLQGHPVFGELPGIENTSGPLGQGLSQAVGIALALKMDGKSNHVFCITSDGEHQEGQTWEAYMLAAKHQLTNLTVVIDNNNIQISGSIKEIMPIEPLKYKLASFGFAVIEINGHDFEQISLALTQVRNQFEPTAIICKTTPGKGVSFMKNNYIWHGKAPSKQELDKALKELEISKN